jgi:hypothetical protein
MQTIAVVTCIVVSNPRKADAQALPLLHVPEEREGEGEEG